MKMNRLNLLRQSSALVVLTAAVWLATSAGLRAAAFSPGNVVVFSADSSSANNTTFSIIELNSASAGSAV